MNYLKYFKRLQFIKDAIEKGSLYSPKFLARKFSCSEKTIRNMINRLKEEGLPIKYSKKEKKYFLDK